MHSSAMQSKQWSVRAPATDGFGPCSALRHLAMLEETASQVPAVGFVCAGVEH